MTDEQKIKVCVFGPSGEFKKHFWNAVESSKRLNNFAAYSKIEYDIDTSIEEYQNQSTYVHFYNLEFINPYLLDEVYDAPDSKMLQSEEREEKYAMDDLHHHTTLLTRHITEADAFIIVYDVRFIEELEKIKIWLNKIFKIKGYDKLLDTMKQDGMCFFPITLMGINNKLELPIFDKDKDEKKNMKITMSKIEKFSLDYCVDYLSANIFADTSWGARLAFLNGLCYFRANVVTFHKYMSLEDKTKYSLQA